MPTRSFPRRILAVMALVALAVICNFTFASAAAGGAPPLEPGLYQAADASATGRVSTLPDGSLQLMLWQGDSAQGPGDGFAWLARLLPGAGGRRLSGLWQSLPGSCCPGRGRLDLEVLGPVSFRVADFSPDLSSSPWQPEEPQEFQRIADLDRATGGRELAGVWNLTIWYTDVLPGRAAGLSRGLLLLTAQDGAARGRWQGLPGQAALSPAAGGGRLVYRDSQAGFDLEADLVSGSDGLYLSGAFRSTLGQGRVLLARQGLPAAPPGPRQQASGALTGLWVDPRTGSDFFDIRGSEAAIEFTAYGGERDNPRYMATGKARLTAPARLEGVAADLPGKCCGNQGRLIFRVVDPDHLEVGAVWWPQGRRDPGTPPSEFYVVERVSQKSDPAAQAKGWPLVEAARPGVPGATAGSLKADFIWRPDGQDRQQTVFSQGGYPQGLSLSVDGRGRPAARFTHLGRIVELAGGQVEAGKTNTAWLIYDAEQGAKLLLNGQEVATGALPAQWSEPPWPYVVGGSRWPGRTFLGRITAVDLWPQAVDPAQPVAASWGVEPSQPAPEAQARALPATRELVRFWHPVRLVHAYAALPEQARALEAAGYRRQGPVGLLWAGPVEGAAELWAHARPEGEYLLSTSPEPPEGYKAMGSLGFAPGAEQTDAVPLWQMEASLADPLRGGPKADRLYTTRSDTPAAAKAAGYGEPTKAAALFTAPEPPFQAPLLYTWAGSWGGDGWGRFYLARRGDELCMFWYYAKLDGPHFFGRYRLAPDGKSAEGIAVGRPGPKATYYSHKLEFDDTSPRGPRIRLISERLAAPLDDGRLVRFKEPRTTRSVLSKLSQAIAPQEDAILGESCQGPSPERQYEQALGAAQAEGRLLER